MKKEDGETTFTNWSGFRREKMEGDGGTRFVREDGTESVDVWDFESTAIVK